MASLLQKLLKTPRAPPPLPFRILPRLGRPHAADADADADTSPLHHQSAPFLFPVNPDAGAEAAWRSPSFLSPIHVYPSFPHCFFAVDPIGGAGTEELLHDDGREMETATVWADSVKKKRKRKMNKHKLRKLRRRLRRQT